MAEGILLIIRAHPSYPCRSVVYSGSQRRSPPARAQRCACGLKPSLSAWKPLRGWRTGARAGWSLPWARGSPCGATAFSPLRAMGKNDWTTCGLGARASPPACGDGGL